MVKESMKTVFGFMLFLFSLSTIGITHQHHKKIRERVREAQEEKKRNFKPIPEDAFKLLTQIYDELQLTTHTVLDKPNLRMYFYPIQDPDYFMESNFFPFQRLVLKKKKYRIGVNPIIFEKDIPYDALVGVMAHEMVHTEDYECYGVLHVGKQLLNTTSKRKYERATDLKVVFKGLSRELIAYKEWLYKQLTPEALKLKKKEYLTPEEIDFVEETLRTLSSKDQELLKAKWLKNTPLTLKAFELSVNSL